MKYHYASGTPMGAFTIYSFDKYLLRTFTVQAWGGDEKRAACCLQGTAIPVMGTSRTS